MLNRPVQNARILFCDLRYKELENMFNPISTCQNSGYIYISSLDGNSFKIELQTKTKTKIVNVRKRQCLHLAHEKIYN